MRDETKAKLGSILSQHNRRADAEARQSTERADERTRQLEAFRRFAATTIRPLMEEIAAQLNGEGHTAEVIAREEVIGEDGKRHRHEEIRLEVIPRGYERSQFRVDPPIPTASFWFDASAAKVHAFASNILPRRGGSSATEWGRAMGDVTTEMIENHLVGAIGKILA